MVCVCVGGGGGGLVSEKNKNKSYFMDRVGKKKKKGKIHQLNFVKLVSSAKLKKM